MGFAWGWTASFVALAVVGCGSRVSVDAESTAGSTGDGGALAASAGGHVGSGGTGTGAGGMAATGGAAPTACTLALAGEPSLPFPDLVSFSRPNLAIRETAAGAEMLLHMWKWEGHVSATFELSETGVPAPVVPPVTIEDGAQGAGALGATGVEGTHVALFPLYPPSLGMQRVSFGGTTGPVVPLDLDVGPAAFGGHVVTFADGPDDVEQLIAYNRMTPVQNGPHLEPTMALANAAAQITHGPVAVDALPEHVGIEGSLSSLWVGDHALAAVTRGPCWSPGDCEASLAVHRAFPIPGGQLEAVTVWTQEAPDASEAALATWEGRVWLALFDEDTAALDIWEIAPDGSVVMGPVAVDMGLTPTSPTTSPLGWGGPGLQITVGPWGLAVSAMKLTAKLPPSGSLVVAELGVAHLSFDMEVLSPPTTWSIVDPAQQSPPRVAATSDGIVAVWEARGFVDDGPFGANDNRRLYVARLLCSR